MPKCCNCRIKSRLLVIWCILFYTPKMCFNIHVNSVRMGCLYNYRSASEHIFPTFKKLCSQKEIQSHLFIQSVFCLQNLLIEKWYWNAILLCHAMPGYGQLNTNRVASAFCEPKKPELFFPLGGTDGDKQPYGAVSFPSSLTKQAPTAAPNTAPTTNGLAERDGKITSDAIGRCGGRPSMVWNSAEPSHNLPLSLDRIMSGSHRGTQDDEPWGPTHLSPAPRPAVLW